MNSFFERIDLEMIALESAIGAFEAENDITEEYLNDYSTPAISAAYESAVDDDFGFGLFGDMSMSPATEEAEADKGSKLGQGIKKILESIKGFFVKIGEGLSAFAQSFKKKKSEVNDADVNISAPAEKVATSLRGAIKQAFTIIGNVTAADTKFVNDICVKINNALSKAGGSKALLDLHNKKMDKSKNSEARDEAMKELGKSFRSDRDYGMTDSMQQANAEKDLKAAEDILDKVKATNSELEGAIVNINEIYTKELNAVMNKIRSETFPDEEFISANTSKSEIDRSRTSDKDAKKKEIEEFNEEAKARRRVGVQTAKRGESLDEVRLQNQIRQKIFLDYNINEVVGLIDKVINTCHNHASNCEKIAKKDTHSDDADTKIAYQMCRVLSTASTVYTKISATIRSLLNGDAFTVKMKNGSYYNGRDELHNKNGQTFNLGERSKAKKDQMAYIDE